MIMSGLARIGRDVELKYTRGGMAVCNVALAFNVGYGDRKTTTWVEAAIWASRQKGLQIICSRVKQLWFTSKT